MAHGCSLEQEAAASQRPDRKQGQAIDLKDRLQGRPSARLHLLKDLQPSKAAAPAEGQVFKHKSRGSHHRREGKRETK